MLPNSPPPVWQLVLTLVVGLIAVSTAAPLIRLAMDAAADRTVGFSLVLAASRLTLASILILPQWRNFYAHQYSVRAVGYAIVAGIALALHFATWITSLAFTSVAAATALVTTNPVWVALLYWIGLGEKPSRKLLTGTGVALAGGLLIGWGGSYPTSSGSNPLLGNSLALMGAWMYSIYLLLGRTAQHSGLSIGSYSVVAYSTAAIALVPLPFFAQATDTRYSPIVYLAILLNALIPQLIGHTSLNWVVRWLSPTIVTLAILLEPVISSLLAFALFSEIPDITVLLGACILLVGVAIAALG